MLHDQTEGFQVSLIRELTILQELSRKPNSYLCHLIDVFLLGSGAPCIVIEFLKGKSLTELLQKSTLLRPEHTKNLCKQLLESVRFLHTNFVMHRDLKPDNVMFSEEGVMKVIDFGMAKVVRPEV